VGAVPPVPAAPAPGAIHMSPIRARLLDEAEVFSICLTFNRGGNHNAAMVAGLVEWAIGCEWIRIRLSANCHSPADAFTHPPGTITCIVSIPDSRLLTPLSFLPPQGARNWRSSSHSVWLFTMVRRWDSRPSGSRVMKVGTRKTSNLSASVPPLSWFVSTRNST